MKTNPRAKAPSSAMDKYMVRLPDGMRAKVQALAKKDHSSMNTVIIQALENHLDNNVRINALLDALTAKTASG